MPTSRQPLVDPSFRLALTNMVKRKVPDTEAEDIVQSALTEALASQSAPNEPEAMRKWVWGIARNKIVDFYRRNRRELAAGDLPDVPVDPAADDADMLRWAERELPPGSDAPKTLEWMLREGEGDKLETIADDESLPAPRVRQRVSRMRRHFRARWAQQVAALAAAGIVLTLVVLYLLRKDDPKQPITQEHPVPQELQHARDLRNHALPLCEGSAWKQCVDELDRAKSLDPAGDTSDDVQRARKQAADVQKQEEEQKRLEDKRKQDERDALEQLNRDSSLKMPVDSSSTGPSKASPKVAPKPTAPAPTATPSGTAAPWSSAPTTIRSRPQPTKPTKPTGTMDMGGGTSGP